MTLPPLRPNRETHSELVATLHDFAAANERLAAENAALRMALRRGLRQRVRRVVRPAEQIEQRGV